MQSQDYFRAMERFWGFLGARLKPNLTELAENRGYLDDHPFFTNTPEVLYCPKDCPEILEAVKGAPSELGLLVHDETKPSPYEFLLSGRWIVPIRLPSGHISAFVGWEPHAISYKMKYLTTPSLYFRKKFLLFGAHNLRTSVTLPLTLEPIPRESLPVFIVEGIFDYLSLNSLGLPAVSVMGKGMSNYQRAQLPLLGKKIIAVPDQDAPDIIEKDAWGIANLRGASYLSWGAGVEGKDLDNLIAYYGFDLFNYLAQTRNELDYHIKLTN